MARFCWLLAVWGIALVSATDVDYSGVLEEYKTKVSSIEWQVHTHTLIRMFSDYLNTQTGSAWPCNWWPSDECACHRPSNCKTTEAGKDAGCCSCKECEAGYKQTAIMPLGDSECGQLDECVKVDVDDCHNHKPSHCKTTEAGKDAGCCSCKECEAGYKQTALMPLPGSECDSLVECVKVDVPDSGSKYECPDYDVLCEIHCDGDDGNKQCQEEGICMHASCDGAIIDGSAAGGSSGGLFLDCSEGCKGAQVVIPDGGAKNVIFCGGDGSKGNCDGLSVTTGNGHIEQFHITCDDGACKNLKVKSTASKMDGFVLQGGSDGFEFTAHSTEFDKFEIDCDYGSDGCQGTYKVTSHGGSYAKQFQVECESGCDGVRADMDMDSGTFEIKGSSECRRMWI